MFGQNFAVCFEARHGQMIWLTSLLKRGELAAKDAVDPASPPRATLPGVATTKVTRFNSGRNNCVSRVFLMQT